MKTFAAFSPCLSFPSPVSVEKLQHDDLLAPLSGPSESVGRLWAQAKAVAPHFRTLLLTGERGSGSESVVHLLQILSPYCAGPLLMLDASLEPEAVAHRLRSPKRLLQSVAGGVLYLHEVGGLSRDAQTDLLRFLRLNRHQLCGLVAFSSRDLYALASAGNFSPALADALGSFSVAVPSLRERQADLPLLAELFLREAHAGSAVSCPVLDRSFLEAATAAHWPGNLEQLRSVMVLLARNTSDSTESSDLLLAADLEAALTDLSHTEQVSHAGSHVRLVKLDTVVQEHIRSVLIACQGNKLRASEILGISRSTLYRMLEAGSSDPLALIA